MSSTSGLVSIGVLPDLAPLPSQFPELPRLRYTEIHPNGSGVQLTEMDGTPLHRMTQHASPTSRFGYKAVAGLTAGVVAMQVFFNHAIGTETSGFAGSAKAVRPDGPSLLVAVAGEALISNIFKGNCRHVSSYKELFTAMAALPAFTLLMEGLACAVDKASGANPFISSAFIIALAVVGQQLGKIFSHELQGKQPFYHGSKDYLQETVHFNPQQWAAHIKGLQRKNSLYLGSVALATAIIGHLTKLGSPLSVIMTMAYSSINRKGGKTAINLVDRPIADEVARFQRLPLNTRQGIGSYQSALRVTGLPAAIQEEIASFDLPKDMFGFMRAQFSHIVANEKGQVVGIKDISEKARLRERRKIVVTNAAIALAASALVGACFPMEEMPAERLEQLWKVLVHVGGAVGAVSLTGLFTDQLFRAADKVKIFGNPPTTSLKKRIIHSIGFMGTTAVGVGAHLINRFYFSSSPLVTLGIAVNLNGLLFHGSREVNKETAVKGKDGVLVRGEAKSPARKAAILFSAGLGVALAGQAALNRLDTSQDGQWSKLLVTGAVFVIALGVLLENFVAKPIRNALLPKLQH
jgi:hypothetical protein